MQRAAGNGNMIRRKLKGLKMETYPSTVKFNPSSVLLVIYGQDARNGGRNGAWWDVSQARTECEGFILLCRLWKRGLRYNIAW